jgi:hypothetical protein
MDGAQLRMKMSARRWMMIRNDREYFEARAEAELRIAQESEDPAVVRVHYQLAELHLERAAQCVAAQCVQVEMDQAPREEIAALG